MLLFALLAPLSAVADHPADPPPGDRVVCVSKQINEFVFDIGAESHLVARDLTSIYPRDILKLPTVGYHRALSSEGIISMRPSVLLTDGNVGPNEVLDRVRSVGISVVTMDPGDTLQGAEDLMIRLGNYFGRKEQAATLVAAWKAGMEEAVGGAGHWAGQNKPRVLIDSLWPDRKFLSRPLAKGSGGTDFGMGRRPERDR